MSARDELRDPWGWLVAGISGGLGWAALAAAMGPAAIIVGAGIGAAVLGAKVAMGSRRTSAPAITRDRLPTPPRQSLQATLIRRAEAAEATLRDLSDRPADPWLRSQVTEVDDDAATIVDGIRELAGRVTVVEFSLRSANPQNLDDQERQLKQAMGLDTDPVVLQERQRALDALNQQKQAVRRLTNARDTLMARLESTVIGVESLAARMGELVAIGTTGVDDDPARRMLGDLTDSLETLRGGLQEAQSLGEDVA